MPLGTRADTPELSTLSVAKLLYKLQSPVGGGGRLPTGCRVSVRVLASSEKKSCRDIHGELIALADHLGHRREALLLAWQRADETRS